MGIVFIFLLNFFLSSFLCFIISTKSNYESFGPEKSQKNNYFEIEKSISNVIHMSKNHKKSKSHKRSVEQASNSTSKISKNYTVEQASNSTNSTSKISKNYTIFDNKTLPNTPENKFFLLCQNHQDCFNCTLTRGCSWDKMSCYFSIEALKT